MNRIWQLTRNHVVLGTFLMAFCVCILGSGVVYGQEITDVSITDTLDDEYLFDQGINANKIDIVTTDGVVTLSGQVNNLLAKRRAESIAKTVKGVRSIINDIVVLPPPGISDSAIERDIESALLFDRATEAYEVIVQVDDYTATLTGTVDSWAEKNLAEKVAAQVRGVKALKNNLVIVYPDERSKIEIKPEIKKRLMWDTLVDDNLINVEVDNKDVTLSGTVGSIAEKDRAYYLAWVYGVESVNTKDLDVELWMRDERLRSGKYVQKSDKQIKEAVNDAMLYDPRVYSFQITPDVEQGTVTLRGEVDNLKAKNEAAKVARNTVGVMYVKNRIKVRPNTPSDAEIHDNIEDAFIRSVPVNRYEIDITVIDGEVWLSGVVGSYYEKGEAQNITSTIYGVEEVNNNLSVEIDAPIIYNPYVSDYYPYDETWYDYEPVVSWKTDAEMLVDINDEIWWSPYLDSEDIVVVVDDGRATLTGTVQSWNQYITATEEAYEGGAVWVNNELDITPAGGETAMKSIGNN